MVKLYDHDSPGVNNPLSNIPLAVPNLLVNKLWIPEPTPLVTVWDSLSLLIHFTISPDSISSLEGLYHFLSSRLVISIDGFADPFGIVTICILVVALFLSSFCA